MIFQIKKTKNGKETGTGIKVNTAQSYMLGDALIDGREETLYLARKRSIGDVLFLVSGADDKKAKFMTWTSAKKWLGAPCVNVEPDTVKKVPWLFPQA